MFIFISFLHSILCSQDLNSINTANQDSTSNSKHRSTPPHGSVNRNVQKTSLQWIKSRSNRKYDSSKKPKAPGLTLLEILCGDFEHGAVMLRTENNNQKDSRPSGNPSNDLGHQRDKQPMKAHKEGRRDKSLSSDIYKSLKSEGKKESIIRSQSNKENRLEDAQSEGGDTSSMSRSNSVSFEALNSDDTLKTSSISTWGLSSQEIFPLQDGSAQKLHRASGGSVNSFGLSEVEKSLQSHQSQSHEWNSSKQTHGKIELLAAENAEHSTFSNKNEESVSSNHACLTSSLEAQAWEHQCRFVHFKKGPKLTRKKDNKQNSGVEMNNEKEKLHRTKGPDVKLFKVDVPQTSQRRKSQVNR